MLINWELGDKETFNLWEKMNSGFMMVLILLIKIWK